MLLLQWIVVLGGSGVVAADEEPLIVALRSCANEDVLSLLSSLFDPSSGRDAILSNGPRALLDEMTSLLELLSVIRKDTDMASQIVSQVNERKEPAWEITQHQKQMKEKKKQKKGETSFKFKEMNGEMNWSLCL